MKPLSREERIQRHLDYWEGRPQKRPLTIVRAGDWFFSREFAANKPLLQKGRPLKPGDVKVEQYLPDYDRMYQSLEALPSDAFFAAEPCTGIPWMEGIAGAQIEGCEDSFISRPVYESIEDIEDFSINLIGNPWYDKYLEFVKVLTEHARERYPAAQPILRGVTDTIGALIGQDEMACATIIAPDVLKQAFSQVVAAQRSLIADAYKISRPFLGGYSFGFYHIWAPGKVMWFQEDLSALLPPADFDRFLRESAEAYIKGYDYSLAHMHPASFRHLDSLLTVADLKVVQINRDVAGPSVRDMLPQMRRVLEAGKNLAIGMGRVVEDDIDAIMDDLPRSRVALNIISNTPEEAIALMEYMQSK